MKTYRFAAAMHFTLGATLIAFSGCGGEHMPIPPPSAQNALKGGSTAKSGGFRSLILPIFQKNCASCHGPGSPLGNWTDYAAVVAKKDRILQRVFVTRDMPKGAPMDDRSRELIANWLKAGAPEEGSDPSPGEPRPAEPAPAPAPAPAPKPGTPQKLANCSGCHGEDGNSPASMFPRLAGQLQPYIDTQLRAFQDQSRSSPDAQNFMWAVATDLTDKDIEELSLYFSNQKPTANVAADSKLADAGKVIFENGIPEKNVTACVACHGVNAEGMATFPRLAGQHSEYVGKQMRYFRDSLRAGTLMPEIAKPMTDSEIDAVSAYLQGL